jgi:alkylated DNA repair dioxygenase AlkB
MMNDLFSNNVQDSCIKIDMQDADVVLYPELFSQEEADNFFNKLKDEISWQQEKIKMFGQVHDIPRLTAWYGEPNKTYVYSGIKVHSDPWTQTLLKIKEKIEKVSSVEFNSVLLNLYRNGADGVSWHSDDETELGHNPVIGSVSFGESRPFQLKHKFNPDLKQKVILEHGSYLLMQGETQHQWFHQIPKSKKQMGERINLTFRVIK